MKSDQDGIEINNILLFGRNYKIVEIRPRWDWNNVATPERLLRYFVEIRPRWDWNYKELRKSLAICLKLKSDQDGIEILLPLVIQPLRILVEIRPRWDWNAFSDEVGLLWGTVEIRPRWDWNRPPCKDYGDLDDELKSDQDGIEICKSQVLPHRLLCWNQTKMGLKFPLSPFLLSFSHQLKSDQDGIEIKLLQAHGRNLPSRLKSDQDGIEIILKELNADFVMQLKSDQDGIEMTH